MIACSFELPALVSAAATVAVSAEAGNAGNAGLAALGEAGRGGAGLPTSRSTASSPNLTPEQHTSSRGRTLCPAHWWWCARLSLVVILRTAIDKLVAGPPAAVGGGCCCSSRRWWTGCCRPSRRRPLTWASWSAQRERRRWGSSSGGGRAAAGVAGRQQPQREKVGCRTPAGFTCCREVIHQLSIPPSLSVSKTYASNHHNPTLHYSVLPGAALISPDGFPPAAHFQWQSGAAVVVFW